MYGPARPPLPARGVGGDWEVWAGDGAGAGPVITIANGETASAVLDGFTITGGSAQKGAGIYIDNTSSPTLKNLIITGNTGSSYGGGVYVYNNSSHKSQGSFNFISIM